MELPLDFDPLFNPLSQLDEELDLNISHQVGLNLDTKFPGEEPHGLPGGYCTYYGRKELLLEPSIVNIWPNVNSVLFENNFIGGATTLDSANEIIKQPSKKGDNSTCINIDGSHQTTFKLFDIEDGVYIDNVISGISYTRFALTNGVPVIFGVNFLNYSESSPEKDVSTNHYVVVVGMGNDGRNYFHAWDIGALFPHPYLHNNVVFNGGTYWGNRLYLDDIWPGLLRADKPWNNSYSINRQSYRVTKIFKSCKFKS